MAKISPREAEFEQMFRDFAREKNIKIERYCSTRLLSFYDQVGSLMLFQLDVDQVAPIVLKPFTNFRVNKLIRKFILQMDDIITEYLLGYVPEDFFDNFGAHNVQNIYMKDGFQSLNDIESYEVELINMSEAQRSTRLYVRFHTQPTPPKFYRDKQMKGTIKYLHVDVYYKDIPSIIEPMLAYYAEEVGQYLGIPVNEVDNNVLKLVEMVKI